MSVVFHAPPGWPRPPLGWLPPVGWRPPSSWPAPPDGWTFYLELVPAYRRHAILVHPARGIVDPAYETGHSRSWAKARASWRWLGRYAMVTVPAGVIAGVVLCILLLGVIAREMNGAEAAAIQACATAVESEVAAQAATSGGAAGERTTASNVTVSDVSDLGTTLLALSGSYRGPLGSGGFTCQVSTATQVPSVAQVVLSPRAS